MDMKTDHKSEKTERERRRFLLGLLGGLGILGLGWSGASPHAQGPREMSLKEANFYRPHDLAG